MKKLWQLWMTSALAVLLLVGCGQEEVKPVENNDNAQQEVTVESKLR